MSGEAALRFTLARSVNLVAVSPGPRPSGPDALPDQVRLVDLATAGELAEIAAALEEPAPAGDAPAVTGEPARPETLDGLIARAEARLGETRSLRDRARRSGG